MFRTKPGEERALIEDWINRPALRKLVEAFDGVWPTGTLEEVVAQLADFSEVWDYRAGTQDRHMFHDEDSEADPYAELTYRAADELGMTDPPPPMQQRYDYLIILGGLATGVESRVNYAARLVRGGLEVRQQVAALGSFRLLQARELPISTRYAPDGRYEIDHLAGMLTAISHTPRPWSTTSVGDPERDPELASVIKTMEPAAGPRLGAYAAASSDPAHRPANTADTFVLLAEANKLESGESLLVVTSGIYVPYQHLDAVRTLRTFDVEIETIGVRRTDGPGPTHTATAYRQEIRSTLRSADCSLQEIW